MIEVELKAVVKVPDRVVELLRTRSDEQVCLYRDTYYDGADGSLGRTGSELRVRTIVSSDHEWHLLTFKTSAVHESGSKSEHESLIKDRQAIEEILVGLGFVVDIAFEKRCRNYRFSAGGREFLATLVQVPEASDETFIEVETLVRDRSEVPSAIAAVTRVLADLGITERDLTERTYQGMVADHRTAAKETR